MMSELTHGLQFAASLAILIWFKDRIRSERWFGWSLVLLCAGYAIPALVLLFGAELQPNLHLLGLAGLLRVASVFCLFFSFIALPFDIGRRPERKPAATKKKTARKKKTTGS